MAVSAPRRRPVPARVLASAALLSLVAACGGRPEAAERDASTPSERLASDVRCVGRRREQRPEAAGPADRTHDVPTGSVVAVKIDNSPLARPYHRGLGQASIVYQELMEGGSSRFLAVYAPATGNEVGPIRSVREGDLELLQQFGQVALAASGGNDGVLATFTQAAKEGRILDANFETLPGPYRKAEKRKDAYNFFTSPQKIDQARPGGAKVKDIGLHFAPLRAGAGFPLHAPASASRRSPRSRPSTSRARGRTRSSRTATG